MEMKKYLDDAFTAIAETIDVGAFKPEDALKMIVTGMKGFAESNGFNFSDEEILEKAKAGMKELAVAEADFHATERESSVNVPFETTREEMLGNAFDSVTAALEPGLFEPEVALKAIITGMQAFSEENSQGFTAEEIRAFAEKKMKELDRAEADFDPAHRADSVNAPVETTHEEFLEYAFESVTAMLDLGAFKPEDAIKMAITGMKAYAYDNGQKFTNEEILETAKKKMKEIFGASKDFEYQDWVMPR